MKKRRQTSKSPWILAALVLLAAATPGQEERAAAVFSEVIDVRVVNIEVVVTDRQGNRVRGLGPSDFELLVDAEPTPIDYFTEIEEGVARVAGGNVAGVPSLEPDMHVATNFLIYIDDLFSIERDRNLVLENLEEDLGQLHPEDRVAAVAFDGAQMETLTTWTNSPERLAEALERASSRDAHGLRRKSEAVMAKNDRDLKAALDAMGRRFSFPGIGRRYAYTLEDQLHHSVLAAVATIRRFANQPGRKVMLLLAGGWTDSPPDRRLAMTADELYGPLVSAANLTGFTIYPVDVPGRGGRNVRTLDRLARATGGLAMPSSRRKEALARVAQDTRSYYWLGFEPSRREDDAFHDLKVNLVGRPDLRVRTREGYVDMSRNREIAMTVETALLFGDPSDAQPLDVYFSEPVRARRGKISVPIEVAIPLDEVALLPVSGLWQNELEVRVLVMDLNGSRADMSTEKIPISGPAEPQPGQFFYYQTDLRLRRREHTYVIAVYDPLTGTTMTSTGEIGPK